MQYYGIYGFYMCGYQPKRPFFCWRAPEASLTNAFVWLWIFSCRNIRQALMFLPWDYIVFNQRHLFVFSLSFYVWTSLIIHFDSFRTSEPLGSVLIARLARAKTSGWRNCGFHSGETSCRVWWLVFWDQWSYLWSVIGLPKNLQIERINVDQWMFNGYFYQMPAFFQIFRDEKMAVPCNVSARRVCGPKPLFLTSSQQWQAPATG